MRNLALVGIGLMLYLSSFADMPRQIEVGSVTALGICTGIYACFAWLLWLARPLVTKRLLYATFPLALFLIWGYASLAWCPALDAGLQNLSVMVTFLGVMLLSARESRRSRRFTGKVLGALAGSTGVTAVLYVFGLAAVGLGAGSFTVSARAFALFALLGLARLLSVWRYCEKRALFWAVLMTALIGFSLSRMAFAVALSLFPLAQRPSRGAREVLRVAGWLVIVIVVGYSTIEYVEPLHERFFSGDMSLEVGGISLNASGRTAFWKATIDSYMDSWVVGKGAGSSEVLIQSRFVDIGHPHNDYLRVLHDYGLVGLLLWLSAIGALFWHLGGAWITADKSHPADAAVHLSALLALVAVSLTMTSDNALVYIYVMGPTGVLVGSSLGVAGAPRRAHGICNLPAHLWVRSGSAV